MVSSFVVVAALCAIGLASNASAKYIEETQLQGPLRFERDADGSDVEVIMEKIKHGLTRLRHAEERINTFVKRIEDNIASGSLKKLIEDTKTAGDEGTADLRHLVEGYKGDDHNSFGFQELIKKISEDSHQLIDQLHGRLDALGHLVDGQATDKSAEV